MGSASDGICAFSGRRFEVWRRPFASAGGEVVWRDIVIHPGAVVILALEATGEVVMIRNRREAVGELLWELPAGTLEPRETPEVTARRELEEETGRMAESWQPLHAFYTTPGFCSEKIYTYLAEGLTRCEQRLEVGEEIEVHPLLLSDALEMIHNGQICDAKTIAALLYYHTFFTCAGRCR